MAAYYVWSGAAGTGTGATWANAYTTLTTAMTGKAGGDVFYVAHDHAESTASSVTLPTGGGIIANPVKVICVNRAGSVPPVSADRRTTATVTTTAGGNLAITGWTHYDGIIFVANSSFILTNANNHWLRFDNCSLRCSGTAGMFVGGSAGSLGATYVEWNNTTVSFADASTTIQVVNILRWRNTPSALLGTIPTILFAPLAARGTLVECAGVDLSAAGSGKTLVGANASTSQAATYRFIDCKLNAAVTRSSVPSGYGTCDIDFVRSGTTGTNAVHRQRISGLLTEETTIVRTGGALG